MSLVTIYALVGDDIRLWATDKEVDTAFYVGLMIGFILFTIEIFVNFGVRNSFFFWLDIIATLSLIPDIIWLSEGVLYLMGGESSFEKVDATPGKIVSSSRSAARISKVIKSLRLIRMIRVIKLYKYVSKTSKELAEGGK